MSTPLDVRNYYRQITDMDIGGLAREMLGGRVTQESGATLFCDCPNHRSQSHRSLHIMLDKQGWYCFGCGVGGDVLQLVEFVQAGVVTRGQSGVMPESHRRARDFLAARDWLAAAVAARPVPGGDRRSRGRAPAHLARAGSTRGAGGDLPPAAGRQRRSARLVQVEIRHRRRDHRAPEDRVCGERARPGARR